MAGGNASFGREEFRQYASYGWHALSTNTKLLVTVPAHQVFVITSLAGAFDGSTSGSFIEAYLTRGGTSYIFWVAAPGSGSAEYLTAPPAPIILEGGDSCSVSCVGGSFDGVLSGYFLPQL